MTRNRRRKNKIRARQRASGEHYTQAARKMDYVRRPIDELLAERAETLRIIDVTDTDATLQAAWSGLCVIGAAAELLSICADSGDYPPRWLLAEPVLSEAVHALRATPALRGHSSEVNPAGGPDDRLDAAAASRIHRRLMETADALAAALTSAAAHARAKGARRACRVGAATARRLLEIYRAGKTVRPDLLTAANHPERLAACTPRQLHRIIGTHLAELREVDPGDTAAALTTAWYGFALCAVFGQFLAARDEDSEVTYRNALPVIARIVEVLEATPSLPTGVHGVGLDTIPDVDPQMMRLAKASIWDLTLAINALLPQVAEQAGHPADQYTARACTMLAAELSDCFQGRLRTFLNPYGRTPGPGSQIIRGKRKPPTNPPGSGRQQR